MVEQGEVERIQVVNRDQAQVFLRKEAIGKYRNDAENRQYARIARERCVQLFFTIGSVDSFREDLSAAEQRSGQYGPRRL